MHKLQVAMWVSLLRQAREGDKEAQEAVEAENQARVKYGEPSIQQELADWLKEQEGTEGKQ